MKTLRHQRKQRQYKLRERIILRLRIEIVDLNTLKILYQDPQFFSLDVHFPKTFVTPFQVTIVSQGYPMAIIGSTHSCVYLLGNMPAPSFEVNLEQFFEVLYPALDYWVKHYPWEDKKRDNSLLPKRSPSETNNLSPIPNRTFIVGDIISFYSKEPK